MFRVNEESRCLWFNSECFEEDILFFWCGMICGLALYNDNIVDINFPLALYKLLLNENVSLEDLEEFDPTAGRSLRSLKNAKKEDNVEDWCLSFTFDFKTVFDEAKTIELIKDGSKK